MKILNSIRWDTDASDGLAFLALLLFIGAIAVIVP